MTDSEDRTLVIFVSDTLRMTFYEEHKGEDIIDQQVYTELESNKFLGFYDMLRNQEENIIGIKLVTGNQAIFEAVRSNDFIIANRDEYYLAVYFGNEKAFTEHYSDDQMFGDHFILKSSDDKYILGFDISTIRETEIADIKKSPYFV